MATVVSGSKGEGSLELSEGSRSGCEGSLDRAPRPVVVSETEREQGRGRDLLADVDGLHEHLTLQIIERKFETDGGRGFEF
jgi:hypothetical protein